MLGGSPFPSSIHIYISPEQSLTPEDRRRAQAADGVLRGFHTFREGHGRVAPRGVRRQETIQVVVEDRLQGWLQNNLLVLLLRSRTTVSLSFSAVFLLFRSVFSFFYFFSSILFLLCILLHILLSFW